MKGYQHCRPLQKIRQDVSGVNDYSLVDGERLDVSMRLQCIIDAGLVNVYVVSKISIA